jgi:hypothetical protein
MDDGGRRGRENAGFVWQFVVFCCFRGGSCCALLVAAMERLTAKKLSPTIARQKFGDARAGWRTKCVGSNATDATEQDILSFLRLLGFVRPA